MAHHSICVYSSISQCSRPGSGITTHVLLTVCCMIQVYNAIEQHTALLKRDAAVRLKLWLTKLNEQVIFVTAQELPTTQQCCQYCPYLHCKHFVQEMH